MFIKVVADPVRPQITKRTRPNLSPQSTQAPDTNGTQIREQSKSARVTMAATTEDQLLQLISDTHSSAEGPRKQAELHLAQAQHNPAFPVSLAAIASHASVSPEIRQSALLLLRSWVERFWNEADPGEHGIVLLDDESKQRLRGSMLELATSGDAERRLRGAAR